MLIMYGYLGKIDQFYINDQAMHIQKTDIYEIYIFMSYNFETKVYKYNVASYYIYVIFI